MSNTTQTQKFATVEREKALPTLAKLMNEHFGLDVATLNDDDLADHLTVFFRTVMPNTAMKRYHPSISFNVRAETISATVLETYFTQTKPYPTMIFNVNVLDLCEFCQSILNDYADDSMGLGEFSHAWDEFLLTQQIRYHQSFK